MEAAKAQKLKEEQQQQQQGKKDVVWATSANANAPAHTKPASAASSAKQKEPAQQAGLPKPPSSKRVGGGFSKRAHRRAESNRDLK